MPSRPSVFISYASQDREVARIIRDALLGAGIEAWYDENELGGGDVWDQKIRRQIRECVYFMPIISANTEARVEGYFRREWRLAAERTLDMADDVAFLIPIAIDQTPQEHARVPEKFQASQWLRLPGGKPTPAFNAWCARVASNEPPPLPRSARVTAASLGTGDHPRIPPAGSPNEAFAFPPFPHQVPGQSVKFVADIAGWLVQTAVAIYKRSPKWVRALIILWVVLMCFRGCPGGDGNLPIHHPATPAQGKKPKPVVKTVPNSEDLGELVRQLSREFGDEHETAPAMLAEVFTAPAGDSAGAGFANEVFSMLYGSLAIDRTASVALDKRSVSAPDLATVLKDARNQDAKYVLTGTVAGDGDKQALTVSVLGADKGDVFWSKVYPVAGGAPGEIAKDIRGHLPPLNASP